MKKLFILLIVSSIFSGCNAEEKRLQGELDYCEEEGSRKKREIEELTKKVEELENELQESQNDLEESQNNLEDCKKEISDLEFDELMRN